MSDLGVPIDHKAIVAPKKEKLTKRELREKELLLILRKLKPQVGKAINTAVKIMGNETASHQNQLKAATIILQNYKEVMEAAYNKEYDDQDGDEIGSDDSPVFSLRVVDQNTIDVPSVSHRTVKSEVIEDDLDD